MKSKINHFYSFTFLCISLLILTSCSSMELLSHKNSLGKKDSELATIVNNTGYYFNLYDNNHDNIVGLPDQSQMKILPGNYIIEATGMIVKDFHVEGLSCSSNITVKATENYYIDVKCSRSISDTDGYNAVYKFNATCSLIEY